MRTLSKIEYVAPFPIYDITVDDDHCFELENGVIAHNSKAVVSGGTGGVYSSNTIFIIGVCFVGNKGSANHRGFIGCNFIYTISK